MIYKTDDFFAQPTVLSTSMKYNMWMLAIMSMNTCARAHTHTYTYTGKQIGGSRITKFKREKIVPIQNHE
jgi:hypothetical protein